VNKEYFDEEFFRGKTGKKGGKRVGTPDNLGILFGVAQNISKTFKKNYSVYEAGAGVGWLSKFLKDFGFQVVSSDVSEWASQNSKRITGVDVYQADVREIMKKEPENKYDLVVAWNVLGYLRPQSIEKALHNLRCISREYIVLSIVVKEILDKRPHGRIGRKTIKPRKWWYEKFKKVGLEVDREKMGEFCFYFKEDPENTGAFVLKKKFSTEIEDSSDNPIVKNDTNFYINILKLKHDTVLEVGCGYGYTVANMGKRGINAFGLEIDKDIIMNSPNKEHIFYGSANNMPFSDNSFDWIIAKSVLEHIYKEEEVIKEFSRVAKKGVYALICLEKRNDPTHINIKTRRQWIKKFEKYGFKEVSDKYNLPEMPKKQREEIFIFLKDFL